MHTITNLLYHKCHDLKYILYSLYFDRSDSDVISTRKYRSDNKGRSSCALS